MLRDVPGSFFTSHLNENAEEIRGVRELFGCDYTTSYAKHGLLGPRSVLAHDVHPTQGELRMLGRSGAAVAHCPTSNAALGSGMFPLGAHLAFGVRVALGSDVGAGTGFSLFKEGLQAYFTQQLLGREGHRLTAGHLLHLATAAGADALGLADTVGDFEVGKALRRPVAEPRARHHARRRPAARRVPRRRAGQGVRAGRRRPTYGRPGSPAHRFVSKYAAWRSLQTADESENGTRGGVVGRPARPPDCRPCHPRRPRPTLRDASGSGHEGPGWMRVIGLAVLAGW